jgi:hypothetical protein
MTGSTACGGSWRSRSSTAASLTARMWAAHANRTISSSSDGRSSTPLYSQSLIPILGIILSPNRCVSGPTRHTLLARVPGDVDSTSLNAELAAHRRGPAVPLFGEHKRRLLEDELLSQVVIGTRAGSTTFPRRVMLHIADGP